MRDFHGRWGENNLCGLEGKPCSWQTGKESHVLPECAVAIGTLSNLAKQTKGWVWSSPGTTRKQNSLFNALFSISCPWTFSKWSLGFGDSAWLLVRLRAHLCLGQ